MANGSKTPPTIPEQLAALEKRVKDLAEENHRLGDQVRDNYEREKDLSRAEQRIDEQEQEMFREIDALRAKARRREKHDLEKASYKTRLAAIRELAKMLPAAKKQAAAGKPALLRLILRATR